MPKLTKRVVDDESPRKAPYFVWDSEVRGFGLRIFPTGRKAFYVDYRNEVGARKRMKLGDYGKLTPDEARRMAMATLGEAVKGDDPLIERQTRRASLTVADLCDRYLEAAQKGLILGKRGRSKKASTLATDKGRIARHIIPLLGRKIVKDLTPADVAKFIRAVAAGETATVEKTGRPRGKAIVEGGAGTAARTAGLLGGILTYAVSEGIIPHNPARGVKRPADGQRTRRLTPEEYGRLGKALREAGIDPESWRGAAGVRLLALTGARLGEIVNLRWSEIDGDGQALRLADSKEGASVRPIGRAAMNVLDAMPSKGGAYVLPGPSATTYAALPAFIERVAKRARLEGVTAHTLRHSFASVAGDLNFSDATIGQMIGHAKNTVTSKYVHRLDEVLVGAADRVAGEIDAAMRAGED